MEKEIITSNEELKELVKEGHFFNFCIAFALNKGFRDAIKEKKDVSFSVGDYEVKFDYKQVCFILTHKNYVFKMINAYFQEIVFIGNSEAEVIMDLLYELDKELAEKI